MRTLKTMVLMITFLFALSGYASPDRGSMLQVQEMELVDNNQSMMANFEGLVITKNEDGLQTLLFMESKVARLVGAEVVDIFFQRGWRQVTREDSGNNTPIDVMCRIGASDVMVAVECGAIGRVAQTPPAIGALEINQEMVNRLGGNGIREAIFDLVMQKRTEVVNTAVEILMQQQHQVQ